jgi:acyl dehydratase
MEGVRRERSEADMDDEGAGPLAVGDAASITRTAGEREVELFAEATGDTNPVHLDEAYAAGTRFGGRIAHGMWSAGLISAVLGTKLPGPGAIYLSQSLKFTAPVRIGDAVTATATVTKARPKRGLYTLETVCRNQAGETVLSGEAVVLFEPARPRP